MTTRAATALTVFVLLLVHHVIEAHTLGPMRDGRAVAVSALAVLGAIPLCTEIARMPGVHPANPAAGTVTVVLGAVLGRRDGSTPGDPR